MPENISNIHIFKIGENEDVAGFFAIINTERDVVHLKNEFLVHLFESVGIMMNHRKMMEDQNQQHERLVKDANYDPLTSLPNRRMFFKNLETRLKNADPEHDIFSLCFIDLDGFKEVNDSLGHDAGDTVLVSVSERLKRATRSNDFAARLSGDEFVVILDSVDNEQVYKRMLEAVSQPIHFDGQVIRISASIGVTVYPHDQSELNTFLSHADEAMYCAKQLGKNQFYVFNSEMEKRKRERNMVLRDIGESLENHNFMLFYQPKINVKTERVEGFEALARWNHPEKGLLGTGSFIEIIENTRYELIFIDFMVSSAINTLKNFKLLGLPYNVSINLTLSQLLSLEFKKQMDFIEKQDADIVKKLYIEIQETKDIDNIEEKINVINRAKSIGINISIDDFGSGYSSLTYFRKVPSDEIKIDREFIMNLSDDDNDDKLLVQSIIQLAHQFGRKIVAEGVETLQQYSVLKSLGCDYVQGYLFSPANRLSDIVLWCDEFHGNQDRLIYKVYDAN
jgi:diguanylate cyclase (GGDEF)-like protein